MRAALRAAGDRACDLLDGGDKAAMRCSYGTADTTCSADVMLSISPVSRSRSRGRSTRAATADTVPALTAGLVDAAECRAALPLPRERSAADCSRRSRSGLGGVGRGVCALLVAALAATRMPLCVGQSSVYTSSCSGAGDVVYSATQTFQNTKFTFLPASGPGAAPSTCGLPGSYAGAGFCCDSASNVGITSAVCGSNPLPAVPLAYGVGDGLYCFDSDGGCTTAGCMGAVSSCGWTDGVQLRSSTPQLWQWAPSTLAGYFQLIHAASGFCMWPNSLTAGQQPSLKVCTAAMAWSWSVTGSLQIYNPDTTAEALYLWSNGTSYSKTPVLSLTALPWASTCMSTARLLAPAASPPPPLPSPPPSPSPPPPPPVVTVASAACPSSNLLAGGSTVTYTIPAYAGLSPVSLAAGINLALATSAVTGLEAAGVSAVWNFPPYGSGGTGVVFSIATGMACGFLQNGVLNRTGFPATSGGVAVTLGAPSGSFPRPAPAYVGTPLTLVCSSCVSWTAPPTAACAPAHRYTPTGATSGQMNQTVRMLGMNPIAVVGSALNLTDSGTSPSATPLYTGLVPLGAQRMAVVRLLACAHSCRPCLMQPTVAPSERSNERAERACR